MNNENEVMEKAPVLTKKDCVKGAIRWSLMAVTTFNYDTQLAPAVVFGIGPLLRKIYKDDDEYVEALNNHYKYFNTMPWLANIVLGATLALEDKEGITSLDAVQNIKVSLMGPLAGIGDSFIWGTLRIIATGVGLSLANQGNILGPILFLLIFNIPAQGLRYYLMNAGYKLGSGFLAKIQENGLMSKLTYAASVLGLMVVGGMTAENVSIKFPLAFGSGDEATTLNDVFNNIMPGLMPLLFTLLVYYLLKKKNIKTTTLLLLCVAIGLIGSFFGILGC